MKKPGIIFFLIIYLMSFRCYLGIPVNGYCDKYMFQGDTVSLEKVDLFKYILDKTHGCPKECGMLIFTTDNCGQKTVEDIFIKLNEYYKLNKKVYKNAEIYSLDFNNRYVEGYVQSVKYENYNVVTINIIQRSNMYEFKNIKNTLNKCIPKKIKKYRYFQYVKARVENGNTEVLNEQIKEILTYCHACDIKTVTLQGGYTNTAYTGRYNSVENGGEKIDFNYAVMKYGRDTYIIIGTPQIMVTY